MRKYNKRRRRKRQLSLNQVVFFFVLLAIISAVIAFFIVRPDLSTNPDHQSPANNITHGKIKTHNNPLNGNWLNTNDGSILEIKGQSYNLELPSVDQHLIETGNCIVRDKQISFTDYDSLSPCKGQTGTYTFTKKNGHLHFTLIRELCPGRSQRFTAVWDSI